MSYRTLDTDEILLWEILVPTIRRVDGRAYTLRIHRVWDDRVRAIAGGLTIQKPVNGQWISQTGELHAERMIPVRIACKRYEIEKIADMTAEYYDQEAVMFYLVSSEVRIKQYGPKIPRDPGRESMARWTRLAKKPRVDLPR